MTSDGISDLMYHMLILALQLCGPILIISMVVGIIISILQAATQIHEQTLTFVPKLIVVAVILVLFGSTMLRSLQDFFLEVLNKMITW